MNEGAPNLAQQSSWVCHTRLKGAKLSMSDLNRGIMKFDGADKPVVVAISAILVLGSILSLIIWALSTAYKVN